LNYVLILPFYVLVPVTERWAVGDGEVSLLMNQISPLLIQTLRPLSGLNNCFPSFHTSMAVSIALILSKSASKRLRRTMYVLAALVIYSTLYLGFHWILDVLAGVLFGAGCTFLASAAVERFRLEFVLYRTR
jgi:membrane-associated phospholipid phosphatase